MKNLFLKENTTIKKALKLLDKTANKVLLVIDDEERLIGTVSDGDIRRYILEGKTIKNNIDKVYNRNPFYFKYGNFNKNDLKEVFLKKRIELIPIVDDQKKVINYYTWDQIFENNILKEHIEEKISVIIMSGGKGTRLEPFTNIFPKALIPIGEKPILEKIIDNFNDFGFKDFFLTLNYKGDMIESYFNGIQKNYQINSIWEKEFLGTAGSLSLLDKNHITDNFIVSNCDIIVKANYKDVIEFHKKNSADLTVLSAIKHYKIPYGVIKFKKRGEIVNIKEKPELTFTINAGIYILKKSCLDLIPKNKKLDMNELIDLLIENKKRIQTYPVNENDYIDIGQWEEYRKTMKLFFNVEEE